MYDLLSGRVQYSSYVTIYYTQGLAEFIFRLSGLVHVCVSAQRNGMPFRIHAPLVVRKVVSGIKRIRQASVVSADISQHVHIRTNGLLYLFQASAHHSWIYKSPSTAGIFL